MKIPCEIIEDLLPLYCDGVCSEESRQAVEAHLAECERCRADAALMGRELKTAPVQAEEEKLARTAAAAWKRGKVRAFARGCLITLLSVVVLAAGYLAAHWFSTVDGSDPDGLARQAAEYLKYEDLRIEETEQRGDYLAALCRDGDGNWCMCVFDRDPLFEDRWRASGGKKSMEKGNISSWNYGSPKREAVLIFCGGELPEEVRWYEFQNGGITYTCPVEGDKVLDIFIIPDSDNIGGYPVLLDKDRREVK